MNNNRGRRPGNEKEPLTLRMDAAHFVALNTLIPGFGSTISEVARYVIMDWMKTNMGMERMRKLGLVK